MINIRLAGGLFMRLRHAATNAHVEHLETVGYAKHKALEAFYEDIIDLADTFAESCQGLAGMNKARLVYSVTPYVFNNSCDKWIPELQTWIMQNRQDICDQSQIQNIIDEIVARINKLAENLTRS